MGKTTANLHALFKLTARTLKPGHLEEGAQSQRVLKTRLSSFITYGLCNNIHKFEDCFLRGQASSNGLKLFNGCMVEYLNFIAKIGLCAKKNLRIFYFKKATSRSDWTIFFQVPRFECPHCNVLVKT